MNIDNFENMLIRFNKKELIDYLMANKLIKREQFCMSCYEKMKLVEYQAIRDGFMFRCMNKACKDYKKRHSIKSGSFFENLNTDFLSIFKILTRWCCDQPQHSIRKKLNLHQKTIQKVILRLLDKIGPIDFSEDKLGGREAIVQVDETMLNYRCKSHRGRSSRNRTDAITIVEYKNNITRASAKVISNKEAATLLPIIIEQVKPFSTIYTDEFRSYSALTSYGFFHGTVCHKYNFINKDTGVNTQGVESFNSQIKLEIKRRKGIKTELRQIFLDEFCWKFNNKMFRLEKILELIKIKN
ncbi:hypothetical protein H312_01798 [Anncaliia algerae PRA339]|uniref:ISXO2-like transposase domain-containing protein n=1 Tax=Anncaliia algerae PRA339 TaxID=1288291 RepID=A0A059F1D4_9MICR|nr:hypothetical protein H312_01798 [Anncaliia algerae PRA339]